MATILEGLNKLSGALGGAETATENLEALNAIAGALGGETTSTNNADAIDQIAEHASGGGGSSDFSTATVTLNLTYPEGVVADIARINTYFDISQASVYGGNIYTDSDNVEVVLYQNKCSVYEIKGSAGNTDYAAENITVSGSVVFDAEAGAYIVTGDCTFSANMVEM